jgi:tRNA modification GTPase
MMLDWKDTIVGLATATGDGCRAILRVAGPDAHRFVAFCLVDSESTDWGRSFRKAAVFRIKAWERNVECVLLSWPEGHSATGQPSVELHLPAGPALASAIQEELISSGARLARRGEFTLRSFLAGKLDLAQAEGVLGLVEAVDARQLAFAVDRRTGGLSRRIAALRSSLLDFLADVEASLDFVEEDIQFVDRSGAQVRLSEALAEIATLRSEHGSRSTSTGRPRVVLLGPPNAGKSSLFNALVGDAKAITSPEPGATRDVLTATVSIDGREIELFDTAGVDQEQQSISPIYGQAADIRERSVQAASYVIDCLPVGEPPSPDWKPGPNRLLVRTQADRLPDFDDPSADCHVSVVAAPGIEGLKKLLAERLDRDAADGLTSAAERTAESLGRAFARLEETATDYAAGGGLELLAAGLRLTLDDLEEIVGAVYTDDLLDRIFSRFCIGK